MSIRKPRKRVKASVCSLALAIIPLLVVGCSKAIPVREVEGVLLVEGKPGHKIRLEFVPEVPGSSPSFAETDANGSFLLEMRDRTTGEARSGAVVGTHRIVLSDLQLAESATGRGVPIRFGADYTLVGTTPLVREVRAGKQSMELSIP